MTGLTPTIALCECCLEPITERLTPESNDEVLHDFCAPCLTQIRSGGEVTRARMTDERWAESLSETYE